MQQDTHIPKNVPMEKRMFFGIKIKVLLLILFILGLVLNAVTVSHIANQKLAKVASSVIQVELAQMGAMQEITEAVRLAGLYSSMLLLVQESDLELYIDRYRDTSNESFDRAHLFLAALAWGSESDAFKEIHNGVLYRRWQELGLNITMVLSEPSPEIFQLASETELYLEGYRVSVDRALADRQNHLLLKQIETSELEDQPIEESYTTPVYEEAMEYLVAVNITLREIKEFSNMEAGGIDDIINDVAEEARVFIIGVILAGSIVVLLVIFWFAHFHVAKPLATLTKIAREIASGRLSRRVEITSHDEIGKLAHVFNVMAANLQSSYDNMENLVKDKTNALTEALNKIEVKNKELEKSQRATINLLEDIEVEKLAVEQKVRERTKDLEREKNKLLQVTGNMKGGGILLNDKLQVTFTNSATYEMLGIKQDVEKEKIVDHFFSYFNGTVIKEHFNEYISEESYHVEEVEVKGKIYEMFFHNLSHALDVNVDEAKYFILFFDITDTKMLEHSKSELVAVASHQLRTPLTAMRGNVEMLIDESFGKLNKEQSEILSDINISTLRLIVMVNDMLDITKIESGSLEMHIETLNVKEILDSVIADLEIYTEQHEVTISCTYSADGICVQGDRIRVRQIFQNLIDNAIKYNRYPGKLEIAVQAKGSHVEVSFKDSGIGIPEKELPKIFGRFYRASNTSRIASGGSGLGLYIVKSIAQQLGGDIRFTTAEGVGTTFIVTLAEAPTV